MTGQACLSPSDRERSSTSCSQARRIGRTTAAAFKRRCTTRSFQAKQVRFLALARKWSTTSSRQQNVSLLLKTFVPPACRYRSMIALQSWRSVLSFMHVTCHSLVVHKQAHVHTSGVFVVGGRRGGVNIEDYATLLSVYFARWRDRLINEIPLNLS